MTRDTFVNKVMNERDYILLEASFRFNIARQDLEAQWQWMIRAK